MDDSIDPTVIKNSIKDLKKFLSNKSHDQSKSYTELDSSVRLKLNFSDTVAHDNSYEEYSFLNDSSFIKKHQQNIAGFDITKKIREKDKEILEGRSTISVLESKLQSLDASYKKTRLQHDSEIETYRKKQLRDKEMIEELEFKLRHMQSREREVKEEGLQAKKQAEISCSHLEKKILQLQASNLEKTALLQEDASQMRDRITALEKEAEHSASLLQVLGLQNKDLEERISSMGLRLREAEETQLKLETANLKLGQANMKIKEYELRLESLKVQENKFHLWESTMKQLPALRNQILKLKEENSMHKITCINIGLLEEKLSSSETQLRVYENRCKELTAENATLVALRELSEQYEATLKQEFKFEFLPPVSEFIETIKELKKKDEVVVNSLSELKASLDSHAHSKDEQENLIKSLTATIKKHEIQSIKNAQIIKRCQRKMFLLSKERDNLKDIISSYEAESTLNPSKVEQERIAHLESQLSDYKAELAKLEEELNAIQKVESYEPKKTVEEKSDRKEEASDNAKMQQLEKVISELSEENESLKMQLEHHGIKGGYDPMQTKVLQFTDNPLEKAYKDRKAEHEKLSQENEAMKKRIQLLEEGENHDLTQKVGMKLSTDGASSKQLKELEEKATSLETRNKRLIEAIKRKSQSMREAVYGLTGYRVDLRGDNHYRLSNMYSESPDDFLLFEQTAKGELHLLETEFSATLEDLIGSYLRQEHSYPAFLSTLTLNLFQRQTMHHQSSSDQEEEEEYEGGEEEEYEGGEEEEGGDDEEEEGDGDADGEGEGEAEAEGEGEDEDDYYEEEDDDDDDRPTKRMRTENEEEEEEEEEEEDDDDDDDELICLD